MHGPTNVKHCVTSLGLQLFKDGVNKHRKPQK